MAKNIVVFSDGTGQEGGKGSSTNVYRLFNMIEDRTPHQVAFYDRGLGTGWRRISGLAFGLGISRNIKECYQFVFENYQAGDEIFLFGFSRGAYTVRSLSGFLNLFGVLPKSRVELIDEAYRIYKIEDDDKRRKEADDFLSRHHTMRCPVRFIGVWDTVKALGMPVRFLDALNPMKHKFHNHRLCDNVKFGCHALSIDDERRTFHPTLWDEHNVNENQEIEQVWFAGVHTDVGGGYPEQGLAEIALDWMVKKACARGMRLYDNHKVTLAPNANGHMHNSRTGMAKMYRKLERSWQHEGVRPVIHQSVLDRTRDRDNLENGYSPWILKNDPVTEPW
jgi:uncharacterized protein (DUF2235 family)